MASKTKKFKREVILKDSRFQHYQKDFLAAILTKDEYTIDEALAIAKALFREEA